MDKIRNIHYVICDHKRHIIAIHRVYDSAIACFDKIVQNLDSQESLYLNSVQTNQYGLVIMEELVKTSVPQSTPRPEICIDQI